MTLEIMIFMLINITTFGLIFSLFHLKKYLKYKDVNKLHEKQAVFLVVQYIAILTIVVVFIWWITLLVFQVYTNGLDSIDYQYQLMIIVIAVITVIMYLILTLVQRKIEKTFQITISEHKSFSFLQLITLIMSLVYASMISYGVQLIILLLNK
ncbi:MAG: hypothetical protein WCR19_06315 [Acholeplasmataceae bacterium]